MKDLRTYLSDLQSSLPDEIASVDKKVAEGQDAVSLVRNLEKQGRRPLLRFNELGDKGYPVVVNAHASLERLAFAFGVESQHFHETYVERLSNKIEPELVSDGPVQERILDADTSVLPQIQPFDDCPAPYISGGIMAVVDPDSGVHNLAYIRMMRVGDSHYTFHAAPGLHTNMILQKYAQKKQPAPAAIIIGYHPAFSMGTLAKVPFDVDEYACASGMLGEAVQLVKAKTQAIHVPAHAEIVIEGEVDPVKEVSEGPYGEFTGFALPATDCPLFKVTAITQREGAIYQDVIPGATEHLLMGKLPKEASMKKTLTSLFPFVREVYMPLSGCGRFHMVISVAPSSPKIIRQLMLAAFSHDHFLKHVYVVNEDVDVTSEADVSWALSTGFQADRDMLVLDQMLGTDLDPSVDLERGTAKVGFDCTRKGDHFPPRFSMDKDSIERMRPEDYL